MRKWKVFYVEGFQIDNPLEKMLNKLQQDGWTIFHIFGLTYIVAYREDDNG